MTKLYYENIEQKIIHNLKNTKNELKIAVAWFTNPVIYNFIYDLAKHGISIELILCDDQINFHNKKVNFQKIIDQGAKIRVSKYPNLMHNKFCIIDKRILINGSYNWTIRAENFNLENVIISTDKELINDFIDYFEKLKARTDILHDISKLEFKNYFSKNEIDLEINTTAKTQNDLEKNEIQEKKSIYTDEINHLIDEAELLYLNTEHQKCIEFSKKMISKYPLIPEFYLIIATSYWRLGKDKDIIEFAKKTIEVNNEIYEAYNLLGIGYSNIRGKEQSAIKNFNICLNKSPNNYIYLHNRANSNIDLANDNSMPIKLRNKYEINAVLDLEKIIQTINKIDQDELNYEHLYSRSFAYSNLNKLRLAQKDINLALDKYNQVTDKFQLDKNKMIEIKDLQRELKRVMKNSR